MQGGIILHFTLLSLAILSFNTSLKSKIIFTPTDTSSQSSITVSENTDGALPPSIRAVLERTDAAKDKVVASECYQSMTHDFKNYCDTIDSSVFLLKNDNFRIIFQCNYDSDSSVRFVSSTVQSRDESIHRGEDDFCVDDEIVFIKYYVSENVDNIESSGE